MEEAYILFSDTPLIKNKLFDQTEKLDLLCFIYGK